MDDLWVGPSSDFLDLKVSHFQVRIITRNWWCMRPIQWCTAAAAAFTRDELSCGSLVYKRTTGCEDKWDRLWIIVQDRITAVSVLTRCSVVTYWRLIIELVYSRASKSLALTLKWCQLNGSSRYTVIQLHSAVAYGMCINTMNFDRMNFILSKFIVFRHLPHARCIAEQQSSVVHFIIGLCLVRYVCPICWSPRLA